MARIKYGAIVTSIHGKIGGTVFQKNAHGFSVKNTPTMIHPASHPQNALKSAVSACSQYWRSLSPAVQGAWNSYAGAYPQFAKYNTNAALAGYYVWMKRNVLSFMINDHSITTPLLQPTTNPIYAPTIHRVSGSVTNINMHANPTYVDIWPECFFSQPVAANSVIRNNQLTYFDAISADSSDNNLVTFFAGTKFSVPALGQKTKSQRCI